MLQARVSVDPSPALSLSVSTGELLGDKLSLAHRYLVEMVKSEQKITKSRAELTSGCSSDLELMHFDPKLPSELLAGLGFDHPQARRK